MKKTFKNGGNTPRNNREAPTRRPKDGEKGHKDARHMLKAARSRFPMSLYGDHAVKAALENPDRVIKAIYATEQSVDDVVALAEDAIRAGRRLPDITLLEREDFDHSLPKGSVHQGIALDCAPLAEVFLTDILNKSSAQEKSVIVMLDQVTDPHNLGAIIRSACAFGADGIVVQSRHAPEVNGLVAKIACGAVEHIPVVYETNLARVIDEVKDYGFFSMALDERGHETISQAQSFPKTLLVLGAEGAGLRPLIRDKCDILVKLPTFGALSSLNVSNAAAVALYAVSTAGSK